MDEHFITHKLGAWEIDLSLAKTFFPKGDLSQIPLVSRKSDQSWLLATAGLALLAAGRPKESKELFIRKTNMQIEDKDWKNASVGYQNLAELQFRIGELESGLESALERHLIQQRKQSLFSVSCFQKHILLGYFIYWAKAKRQTFGSVRQMSFK
jgi:hypothetical protein